MASGIITNKYKRFVIDNVSFDYTVASQAAYHTNIKTLIDAKMPTGAKFFGMTGWTTGTSHTHVQQLHYHNSDWSCHIRNSSSSTQSATCYIYFIYEI